MLFRADLLKGMEPSPRPIHERVAAEDSIRIPEWLQKAFPHGVVRGTLGELLLRYLLRLRLKADAVEVAPERLFACLYEFRRLGTSIHG
jgi:hypothetical protein